MPFLPHFVYTLHLCMQKVINSLLLLLLVCRLEQLVRLGPVHPSQRSRIRAERFLPLPDENLQQSGSEERRVALQGRTRRCNELHRPRGLDALVGVVRVFCNLRDGCENENAHLHKSRPSTRRPSVRRTRDIGSRMHR